MDYEYVKDLFNVDRAYSSTVRLWKHLSSNTYYVSYDFNETKTSPYRSYLSQNAKQLTTYDFLSGVVEYNKSYWKLN